MHHKAFSLKSEFAKNTFKLTIGTSVAQAIPMIFYPVLGRIFTPGDFGLLATIASITAIISVYSTGMYDRSILITDTKKEAANVIGLVLLMSFFILLISYFILQFIIVQYTTWLKDPQLKEWLFICPISAFMVIIYNCYNEWSVRNKYFTNLSWNKIINAGSTTLGKLFFGIIKITSNGLIVGDVIGRTISAIGCIVRALQKDKEVFFQISFKRMKYLSKRYIEFPLYSLPGQLINTIVGQLPIIMIASIFNNIEVGYFAMTMNVLSVPISVISIAIRDTFRQKANEDYKKHGNCRYLFNKTFKILSTFAILGSTILIFILPELFSVLLGNQWRLAGEYSQILLPMIAIAFVTNSLNGVLIIVEKMKIDLFFQIYYLIITILSFWLGYWIFHNMKMTLLFYAFGRSSAYLLQLYLSYKYSLPKGNSL